MTKVNTYSFIIAKTEYEIFFLNFTFEILAKCRRPRFRTRISILCFCFMGRESAENTRVDNSY